MSDFIVISARLIGGVSRRQRYRFIYIVVFGGAMSRCARTATNTGPNDCNHREEIKQEARVTTVARAFAVFIPLRRGPPRGARCRSEALMLRSAAASRASRRPHPEEPAKRASRRTRAGLARVRRHSFSSYGDSTPRLRAGGRSRVQSAMQLEKKKWASVPDASRGP